MLGEIGDVTFKTNVVEQEDHWKVLLGYLKKNKRKK
jgi:hypothetical protein